MLIENLQIVEVPVKKIKLDPRNSRLHSTEQIQQIAASIEQFGMVNPVLLDDDNVLIAGEGRVLGCKMLGMKKVPAIYLSHLSERQRRAYAIADNRLPQNASWNFERLSDEMNYLLDANFDVSIVGFNEQEMEAIMAGAASMLPDGWQEKKVEVKAHERAIKLKKGKVGDDDVPKKARTAISVPGDIWTLGRHRVMCGSSKDASDVYRLLEGDVPRLMVTDPPYGVEYDPEWRDEVVGGDNKLETVANDDQFDWTESYRLFPGDVAYVWHAATFCGEVSQNIRDADFIIRSHIIWKKQHFVFSRGHYHWGHEPCFYAVRKGRTAGWIGDRKQQTIWEFANNNPFGGATEDERTEHSTQKPVEAMLRPILNHSGDVYDAFAGSGSTVIACEKADRACYAMELDPYWVDTIVRRWENFTGQEAVDQNGMTFKQRENG